MTGLSEREHGLAIRITIRRIELAVGDLLLAAVAERDDQRLRDGRAAGDRTRDRHGLAPREAVRNPTRDGVIDPSESRLGGERQAPWVGNLYAIRIDVEYRLEQH